MGMVPVCLCVPQVDEAWGILRGILMFVEWNNALVKLAAWVCGWVGVTPQSPFFSQGFK